MTLKKSLIQKAIEDAARERELIERGMAAVQKLDPIVRETFRDDPKALAEWEEAIRIDTSPRKSVKAAVPKSKAEG